jgi:hypothetical protein
MSRRNRIAAPIAAAAALAGAATFAAVGRADSPPVGPLPSGPTAIVQTQKGQLVAFALPRRSGGRVWRIARKFNAAVVRQVSEADVGSSVVLVFKAAGTGTTTVAFGLTRGETSKAFESRRFTVRVR